MSRVLRHLAVRREEPLVLGPEDGASVGIAELLNLPAFQKLGDKRGDIIECANALSKSNKRRFELYQSDDGAERARAYQGHSVPRPTAGRPRAPRITEIPTSRYRY